MWQGFDDDNKLHLSKNMMMSNGDFGQNKDTSFSHPFKQYEKWMEHPSDEWSPWSVNTGKWTRSMHTNIKSYKPETSSVDYRLSKLEELEQWEINKDIQY